ASILNGASAAAGIAAINSLGNLSGFAGPFAMGYLKDLTGGFTAGLLLNLSGAGLTGWQWLFICEALPSVLVGFAVLAMLPDFPRQANWLQPDEIKWVQNTLETERQKKEAVEHISVMQS
ncbi:MAG: hypothetical protein ACK463_41425, partial [Bradyrhizobium sp.]